MNFPGIRTLKGLMKVQWRFLPVYYVHCLSHLFPNDETFKSIRAFILKLFGLSIGKNSKIGQGVFILDYRNLKIGKNTIINHQAYFDSYKEITIGNGCDIGFRTCFITGNHVLQSNFKTDRPLDESKCLPIKIEDFVWIGANVTILPGVTIKRGSVIGAGAIVISDIEPYSLAVGIPAKVVRAL